MFFVRGEVARKYEKILKKKKVLADYEKNPNAHGELIESGTFSEKV